MRHITKLCAVLLVLVATGCASFDTHVFRAEQTAANVGHATYVGWTNYMASFPVTEQASNEVKQARLKLGSTLLTLDSLRRSYRTNSEVKPAISAFLKTVSDDTSNIVWTINYWKGTPQ